MNKSLQQVKEFHETFGHPVGTLDGVEERKNRQLRIKLIFEELGELAEASDCQETMLKLSFNYVTERIKTNLTITDKKKEEMWGEVVDDMTITPDGDNVNKLEELDACADIQYVLSGKIITAGLHEIFDREFNKVHTNNMSKAHNDLDGAQITLNNIAGKGFIANPVPGKFVVYNNDRKVIKPYNHTKVALSLEPNKSINENY